MTSILLLASLAAAPLQGVGSGPAAVQFSAVDTVRGTDADTASSPTGPAGGVIQGRVLSDRSGMALPLVLVEVGEGESYRAVLTDEGGHYRLRGVPPGRRTVRARSLDHAPHEVTVDVPSDGRVSLDLSLPIRPIGLPAIKVVTRPDEGVFMDDGGGSGLRRSPASTRLRALESSPGAAEIGLANAARSVNRTDPGNASSVLFVRGGASDLKLVLVDGAPVSSPFHLGGVIDPLPQGAIASSTVHRGGAPARLDGGVSYILELESRSNLEEEGHRANGAADLVGARARIEGPLPGGSYLASGRSIHAAGADRILESPLPLAYSDALARAQWGLTRTDSLVATAFWNHEAVSLGGTTVSPSSAAWGNRAGSVRYRGQTGNTRLRVTVGGGEFRARIPIGVGTGDFASGTSQRLRVVAEARRGTERLDVSTGASYEAHATRYRALADGGDTPDRARHGTGRTVAAFSDLRWEASPQVSVRAGLRGNFFLDVGDTRLSPRFELNWTPIPELSLSAASGRYHQYVRSATSLLPGSLGTTDVASGDAGSRALDDLSIAGATHYTLSALGRPTEELALGGEAYVKDFDDPPGAVEFRTIGFDGWADWTHDEWSAWAGLVMSWTWAPDTPLTPAEIQSEERLAIHDRRLATGGFRAPLPSGVRISMEVTTSTGLPFTPFPATSSAGGAGAPGAGPSADIPNVEIPRLIRTPRSSYLRLDAEIYRSWSAHFMDTPVRITPYVRVLNALDRNDALFYRYVREADLVRRRSLGVVPLLPVVGLEWSLL